ncbi:MAG: hypothetical protein H5U10_17250, partial [Desulfacinum sp.]|nr:hypothetical protein [Desulfacinum sp.]
MKKRIGTLLLLVVLVTGCAGRQALKQNYMQDMAARVDMASVEDHTRFQKDLATCADLAAEWHYRAQNEAMANSLVGALLGAGLGYGLGRAWGGHNDAGWTATGAAAGAAGGMGSVQNRADTVFKNCMQNRGYKLRSDNRKLTICDNPILTTLSHASLRMRRGESSCLPPVCELPE